MEQNRLLSREEVLSDFSRIGRSVRRWALENGFCPNTVRSVLKGRISGRIGQGHKIAVMLGLKDGEIVEDDSHE